MKLKLDKDLMKTVSKDRRKAGLITILATATVCWAFEAWTGAGASAGISIMRQAARNHGCEAEIDGAVEEMVTEYGLGE